LEFGLEEESELVEWVVVVVVILLLHRSPTGGR
jgi:hypothetical protein